MRQEQTTGPELSEDTIRRVDILFPPEDRDRVKALLTERCGFRVPGFRMAGADRLRFAALKVSDGEVTKLERAISLAQRDFRDLLVAAGFANNVHEHLEWQPKPFQEPSQVDPVALAAGIQERLRAVLAPLGFARNEETWTRGGEVPQSLRLVKGLNDRMEARFWLELRLEARPRGVLLRMPRFESMQSLTGNTGFVFRAGGDPGAFEASVMDSVTHWALPWFERFTSIGEIANGFADKTFHPHIPVEGYAMLH
jgi:hypothetical protein